MIGFLAPLRDKYVQQFRRLQKFYAESSNLKYLVSLISVPKLPPNPPTFLASNTRERERSPTPEPVPPMPVPQFDDREQEPFFSVDPAGDAALFPGSYRNGAPATPQTPLGSFGIGSSPNNAFGSPSAAQQQLHQQQQQQQQLQDELHQVNEQLIQAHDSLSQYDRKLKMAEAELASMRRRTQDEDGSRLAQMEQLRTAQADAANWKAKYDKLFALYTQLRNDHLSLLKAHNDCAKTQSASHANKMAFEQLQQEKSAEVGELMRTRDSLAKDLEALRKVNSSWPVRFDVLANLNALDAHG